MPAMIRRQMLLALPHRQGLQMGGHRYHRPRLPRPCWMQIDGKQDRSRRSNPRLWNESEVKMAPIFWSLEPTLRGTDRRDLAACSSAAAALASTIPIPIPISGHAAFRLQVLAQPTNN